MVRFLTVSFLLLRIPSFSQSNSTLPIRIGMYFIDPKSNQFYLGELSTWQYDQQGRDVNFFRYVNNPSIHQMQIGGSYTKEYDQHGNLVKNVDNYWYHYPDSAFTNTTINTYDNNGCIQKREINGMITYFTTTTNCLVTLSYNSDNSTTRATVNTYSANLLTRARDYSITGNDSTLIGEQLYSYDAQGHLLTKEQTHDSRYRYFYNSNGNVIRKEYSAYQNNTWVIGEIDNYVYSGSDLITTTIDSYAPTSSLSRTYRFVVTNYLNNSTHWVDSVYNQNIWYDQQGDSTYSGAMTVYKRRCDGLELESLLRQGGIKTETTYLSQAGCEPPLSSNAQLFPNPTTGLFSISLEKTSDNMQVEFYSDKGQLARSFFFEKNINPMEFLLYDLTPGLYVVRIRGENFSMSQRMVKQ